MISDDAYRKALGKLQLLCSKREYCSRDIYRKALVAAEGDSEAAGKLVDSLKADRFVDDGRYAGAFARDKASISGWGRHKISSALLARGIDRCVIEEALETVDGDKADLRLEKLLTAKWKSLCDDPQGKFKLLRFALSRGYDYELIRPVVENIVSGELRGGEESGDI